MFLMPFSLICLCMKSFSMKQKVIFHTQSVLSLNCALHGVLFLWRLMFNCIMHTQVLSICASKILLASQTRSSSCSLYFFPSLTTFLPFRTSVSSWKVRSGDILRSWQKRGHLWSRRCFTRRAHWLHRFTCGPKKAFISLSSTRVSSVATSVLHR